MSVAEDLDEIVPKLFLGGLEAATSISTLNKFHINHILTIENTPLPRYITCLGHLTTKYIELVDRPEKDLFIHLDDTFDFIEKGLSKGAVLVHCYFGVSRSATLVIGYLMKKYGLSTSAAFRKVKAKRQFICPNEGFVAQLKLYEELGYKVNKLDIRCKLFRLKLAMEEMRECRNLSYNFVDLIQPDPGLFPSQSRTDTFQCKNCHRVLATKNNLFPHQSKNMPCTKTHFFEPISWMNVEEITKGELYCPNCKQHVGSFKWFGWRCACEFKMVPAFYLDPTEVD